MGNSPPIRYSPPKSSIWGHATKSIPIVKFRAGMKDFVAQAVRRARPPRCSVSASDGGLTDSAASDFLRKFTAATGVKFDRQRGPTDVSEKKFEECLDWLVAEEASFSQLNRDKAFLLFLDRFYRVQEWNCEPIGPLKLACMLRDSYGSRQGIGTHFAFKDVAEYRWVKELIRQTIGIELNDKHVKPQKALAAPGID